MIVKESAAASISQELTADHERLDRLFDDACSRAGAGDFVGATPAFREFARGLAHHIAVEERLLFPALEARAGMAGPTTVMRHEHRAIEQLIALAEDSLQSQDAIRFGAEAAELAAILAGHNMKEERILYPRSDAALDEAERSRVLAALRL
jgi:iron-sulfur cluster repair protein YtfE (RIC family)